MKKNIDKKKSSIYTYIQTYIYSHNNNCRLIYEQKKDKHPKNFYVYITFVIARNSANIYRKYYLYLLYNLI